VIEGLAPIWTDLNGDNLPEIIVTQSDLTEGVRLAIFQDDGEIFATGPSIGIGYRWRHTLAVSPFGPDGELELAVVGAPHIGGVVEFYALSGEALSKNAELPGYSRHTIGSCKLDTASAGDFDGDDNVELLVPDQAHEDLVAICKQQNAAVAVWSLPLDGHNATNLAAVALKGSKIGVGVGTDQNNLRLWIL
jgi:hypothetical protein